MAKEISDLQDIINRRADEKLGQMSIAIQEAVQKMDGQIPGWIGVKPSDLFTENEIKENRASSSTTITRKFADALADLLREKNREREAEAFVAEIDSIKSRVEDLTAQVGG